MKTNLDRAFYRAFQSVFGCGFRCAFAFSALRLAGWAGAALLLAACSTTAAYDDSLEAWVGAPQQELLEKWGEPDIRTPKTGGGVVLQYDSERTLTVPADQVVGAPGSGGTTFREREYRFWCSTRFEIDARGLVAKYSFKGNDCKAPEE